MHAPAPPTDPHVAQPLLSSADVRAAESAAFASGRDADALMARAGEGAWRVLLQHWPQAQVVGVVCGPGNNGGDGYVLARHALAAGRRVHVLRVGGEPRTPTAQAAEQAWRAAGGAIAAFAGALPHADVWVDALFGIGLARAPDGDAKACIEALAHAGAPVLALDVPSGVDADTGATPGVAVAADVTVTFIAAKPGLFTGRGRVQAGRVQVDALDLPVPANAALVALRPAWLSQVLAPRVRDAHKGDHGHVLCIGGDDGFGGAVMLCAEAALRAGAGLVSVATRPAHVAPLLARRPELMVRGVDAVDDLSPMLARADVIAIGPGLGQGAWSRALLHAALASGKPCVLDADALNLIASGAGAVPADAVVTPHPGEAARMLATSTAAIAHDRILAARTLADRTGAAVVLKGAGTVVAHAGVVSVIDAGNPGMAVGGMGDVLTGVIAALRAQGMDAGLAARAGALLHAAAGDDAATAGGERGLVASDLFPFLQRRANPA